MRCAIGQGKWRRRNIHFPISHQYITVAPNPPKALVLVNVSTVGIQETTVTNYQIQNRVSIAIRPFWITAEYIEHLASIVFAAWNLAIAVIVGVPARISQPFQLEPLTVANELEIRISVATRFIIILTYVIKARLEPVLEMEFFVILIVALNEDAIAHGGDTFLEHGAYKAHEFASS